MPLEASLTIPIQLTTENIQTGGILTFLQPREAQQ